MRLMETGSSDEGTDYSILEIADTPYRHPYAVYRVLRLVEKVAVMGNVFYRSDLETLLPGGWLNDKIINAYMEMLASHHKEAYFFSTFLYLHLRTKSIKEAAEWFADLDLEGYKSFVFPIHASSHWALVIVQGSELLGFDSLGTMGLGCIATIRTFMDELYLARRRIFRPALARLMSDKVPQQTNGDDCGVFCCAYARYYTIEGVHNQFVSSDIPLMRARILHEILVGKIIYT